MTQVRWSITAAYSGTIHSRDCTFIPRGFLKIYSTKLAHVLGESDMCLSLSDFGLAHWGPSLDFSSHILLYS